MERLAQQLDFPGIAALWQEAFGDPEAEIRQFFAAFPACISYVTVDRGQVVAMAHALPQTLMPKGPAAYLYAVATARTHRGRGLCRSLMAFAEQDLKKRGFLCCVLSPAEAGLFDYYRSMGYETGFVRQRTAFLGGQPIDIGEYLRRREQLLNGVHMRCDQNTLRYAARCYGLQFYATDTGIAAVGTHGPAEVLPEDTRGGQPNGMVKWLCGTGAEETGYLGFALE